MGNFKIRTYAYSIKDEAKIGDKIGSATIYVNDCEFNNIDIVMKNNAYFVKLNDEQLKLFQSKIANWEDYIIPSSKNFRREIKNDIIRDFETNSAWGSSFMGALK